MVEIGQVLLAAPRSFCAGVDRAIEIVEILLEQHGAPVYVRHQIVHNDHVVKRLEGLGAVFVDHENEIPAGAICVLSAHGVAPSVRANCESRGLRVVDAVCPLVSKVHAEARRYADSGHLVALVGHADHVEVIGTRGERPESTVVIESPEDAAELDSGGKPIAVITQTTLSLDDVAETVDALGERFGDLRRPAADDICYATQNRQDAVKELAKQGATLILVIGSETSSNARRLVEVAERHGATALLIDGESGIDPELLEGHETVGVTAGASTPEELVALVLRGLASFGYDELGEVEVARENVQLPPAAGGHHAGMTSVEVPYSIASALPSLTVLDITNEIRRELSSSGRESGIAYVSPLDEVAPRARAGAGVRLLHRPRGAAHASRPAGRARARAAALHPARPSRRADPVRRRRPLPRPVAADPAARLRPPVRAALAPDAARLGISGPGPDV